MTGNSLAHLLCQEQKMRNGADVRVVSNRRTHIRKIGLIAVAAVLTLVGIGGWLHWVTASSQAGVATPTIDPMEITMKAGHLPVAHFVDYTFYFDQQQ